MKKKFQRISKFVLPMSFIIGFSLVVFIVSCSLNVSGNPGAGTSIDGQTPSYPNMPTRAAAMVIDTNVTVDASTVVRTIPEDLFGNNIAAWNGTTDGKHAFLDDFVKVSGIKLIRYPGGSWADIVAWDTVGTVASNSWQLDNNEAIAFAKDVGASLQAIVNFSGYWDGVQHTYAETIAKASNWVAYMKNTAAFPIKYWEIGNECFGSWEQGYTNGAVYGSRFADFYKAMKAIDSTIQVGAVSTPYDNGDGWTGYTWWMRDMLSNSIAKGVIPDYLIIHTYPMDEAMSADADARLLQAPWTIAQLTANLDQMVAKYIGSSYVGKIPYRMTEYRSVLSSRAQTVTFLDAMFTAQYIMEMAKYGWTGANLWNIRNGWDTSYNGDYGIFSSTVDDYYTTYLVFPFLTSKFGRNMLTASVTSNSYINAYAAKDASGNVTVLLINNSPDTDLTAQVNITGFTAATNGLQWVLAPAGTTASGSTTPVQECTNISYNGVVHPNAQTTYYMSGIPIKTGTSFPVPVKKSTIVIVKVPSTANASSSSSVSSMTFASSSSRPSDIVFNVPGKVEAEYYTNMSGIQVEECSDTGGGYDVGWINYGDWCDYNINVQTAGSYLVDYRIAGVGSAGTIQLLINGGWLTETTIPSTGDWQIWSNITTAAVNLSAGRQVLRLFFNGTGYNINWANFRLAGASSSSVQSSSSRSSSSSVVSSSSSSRSSAVSSVSSAVSSSRSSVVSSAVSSSRSSAVSSATSSVSGGYAVNYNISNDWGTGATVTVTMKNNSATALSSWTLVWTFAGNQIITQIWSATQTTSGATVTAKNMSYNGTIGANGGTQAFGFNLSYSGSNAKPTAFTLNGTACSIY